MTTDEGIWLRPVQPGDLPRIYDLQLDPESNRMAVTIPRTREAFDSHWAKFWMLRRTPPEPCSLARRW